MKIISWNINGLKAMMKKGLVDIIKKLNADFYLFQEIKSKDIPITFQLLGYKVYSFPAEKKGYSGVMTLAKYDPLNVYYGINNKKFDIEGRVLTLEYENFYLINVYFPNAGQDTLKRLDFKLEFDKEFENYILSLKKPCIICGDFNVAHKDIDIYAPDKFRRYAGFTDEERQWFDHFLSLGFIDTFRYINGDIIKYSWFSPRGNMREKNLGWRIDYCVVSKELKEKIKNADILYDIYGSDHLPVVLEIDI
ncbi:exodeoxyribonuclease III [Nanoarchaeota archaeon]